MSAPGAAGVLTKTGLYAGAWDYLANRAAVQQLGCGALRTTNSGMTDAAWQAMCADGSDVHVTITGNDRSQFASDDAWIAAYLGQVDAYLSRWPAPWVEIWNEPNFGMWAGASAAQKQAAYGKLLVASYQHIKAQWPGVGVVGFGAGAVSAAAPGFIRGVFAAVPAAAQSFDVCSLHPYFGDTAPEQTKKEAWGSWTIASQVAAIRAMGVTKPIWFTETGWAISKSDGGTYVNSNTVSPTLQAAYRTRMFILCLKLGVARLHNMYVVDTNNYNGGFFKSGVARPQATALRLQQRMLPNPTAISALSEGPDVYAYRVTTSNGPVVVAWSDTGAKTSFPSLGCLPGAQIVDMLGTSVSTLSASTPTLTLSSTPIYITGGLALSVGGAQVSGVSTSSAASSTPAAAPTSAATPQPVAATPSAPASSAPTSPQPTSAAARTSMSSTPTVTTSAPKPSTPAKATVAPTSRTAATRTTAAKPKPSPKPKAKAKPKKHRKRHH